MFLQVYLAYIGLATLWGADVKIAAIPEPEAFTFGHRIGRSMVTYTLLRLIAVAFLVALNAFFVAAEFALVSVRETRLLQLIDANKIGARTVQRLHSRLDEVLAAVQLGVTIASLALGWIGESAIAVVLQPSFRQAAAWQVSSRTDWRPAISFTLITFFHVTTG